MTKKGSLLAQQCAGTGSGQGTSFPPITLKKMVAATSSFTLCYGGRSLGTTLMIWCYTEHTRMLHSIGSRQLQYYLAVP